ncbi:MAG: hypothetical protein N2258_01670 [Brevinematales bacterium]|nr:hypothetical protein [Brevinematales bacterium]
MLLRIVSIISGLITILLSFILVIVGLLFPFERNSFFYALIVNIFDLFFLITTTVGLIVSIKKRSNIFIFSFLFLLLIFISSIFIIIFKINLPFIIYILFDIFVLFIVLNFLLFLNKKE